MSMMLPSVLATVEELVQPEIRTALERIDERTRLVAGYQLGYWDATGEPSGRAGKGLRPGLALLSARAAGQPMERGLPAAVAVELVHNFSLLHDDVIDGDRERRHRPTAWAAFGIGPAILAGDALLGLADEVICAAPDVDVRAGLATLHTAIRRLIAGQAADVEFEHRSDVTLDECLAMARDKTAALLACSATLGAVLCGASPAVVDGLARYGERLGLAFQLVDDLLGIWGEPAVTGKPVLADLRARKKSVPVVRALTAGGPAGSQLAELYASPGDLSATELALAATLIEEAGARDWTEKQADRLLTEALAELDQLGEVGATGGADLPGVHADLVAIAHFMTGRDH
ncbi:polyprenyl synthetase family protein [Micromonospora sp. HM5-17]|jgi:geranylgeranyl diphosphate synthase type I|uniref:polyprenyl synthetase family protein n=1 Tax=Micromonospora sp. HM5-17 TaxID=2487710 RepID=UPI000F463C73|nr:polyprenyl synthetase family protein [Micromonospora sp. HM5-17]ROT29777.1 polyprenyl synthetase family protein [Micromonospora sp. HM5-17]